MSDDHFNWIDEDSVIVQTQLAIAVYRNARGDIVIRRQADLDLCEDEDVWVIVSPSRARALAEAILREAGETIAAPLALPAPDRAKDSTAAERQRRYRARKRTGATVTHGERDAPVTQFDGDARTRVPQHHDQQEEAA